MVDYTHNDPREQFYLLLNDGQGRFTDVADAAGVANRNWPLYNKSEGAQAVDFDGDGDLDLFAASHFYFNEGVTGGIPRFVDRRAELGLPLRFDEGLRFLDFDNDGRLDLLLQHPSEGPQLWRFTGTHVRAGAAAGQRLRPQLRRRRLRPQRRRLRGFDLRAGRHDADPHPAQHRHRRLHREPADHARRRGRRRDGLWRLRRRRAARPRPPRQRVARDRPQHHLARRPDADHARPRRRQRRHNQYGRVARIGPRQAPGVVYTRVVDGGSGFLAQGQYALLVGTPYAGPFDVSVRFAAAR